MARKAANRLNSTATEAKNGPVIPMQLMKNGRSRERCVSQTIAAANQKLAASLEMAEERIKEMNALMAVVQEEAEGVFVTTASTLRGVRTGIHEAFDKEEELDARYIESGTECEKPRPRVRPRDEHGRGA